MNEEQYKKLCRACDEILLSKEAGLSRIAIPWLHVLNEHPENIKKYVALFGKEHSVVKPAFLQFFLQSFKSLARISRIPKRPSMSNNRPIVFISHLLNSAQVGNPVDFYFGNLPRELIKLNVPNLVLLINHTELDTSILSRSWDASAGERVFFPLNLSFIQECKIRIDLLMESFKLFRKGRKETDKFKKAVAFRAASEALTSSSIFALRMYYYIFSIVKSTNAKSIAVTFEGHSWERIVFAAARKGNSSICCIGYHHTIIFPRQHALLRNLPKEFQPDVILTAGDYASSHFKKAYPSNVNVATLGMHRLQTNDQSINELNIKNITPTCLVIPDGILSEVLYMFRLTLSAANEVPEINFLFRLHPSISRESIVDQYREFKKLPNNVSFSVHDIQTDFELSNWALYRGTNAVIYATIAGLRPIYLAKEYELGIDSLFELHTWKKTVYNVPEFVDILREDLQKGKIDLEIESKDVIEKVKRYIMPVNNDVFFEYGNNKIN